MPKIVADLHIHSHFSRATSQDLDFEHLSRWAQMKGVQVVATGDIAHPGWLQEMKLKLEPAEEGLFRLKDEYAEMVRQTVPAACQNPVRFLLMGEVSNIYKRHDKVRKIHHLLSFPTFAALEKLQARLERIGNIRSDGRPILGLDSHDLLEIVLETDPQGYLIPAHIWTPWFALFGSMSGFDTIEGCFADLTPHIFALETGLSSDPPMNWRVSALDGYTLISNSDAHSPGKVAREATIIDSELSYPTLFAAMKAGGERVATLEFFPEEGKYHCDGHRKCNVRWEPATTKAHHNLCSVCGKPVTVGVLNRIDMLADRPVGHKPARLQPFTNLIPLPEILGEVYEVGPASKQVAQNYTLLLNKLGPELAILQEIPLAEIESIGGALLAEGIRRVRNGAVSIAAGYDGEYGVISLFEMGERVAITSQMGLFGAEKTTAKAKPSKSKSPKKVVAALVPSLFSEPECEPPPPALRYAEPQIRVSLIAEPTLHYTYQATPLQQTDLFADPPALNGATNHKNGDHPAPSAVESSVNPLLTGLNDQQRQAVFSNDVPLLIIAGPGTGKTRTLTYRLARLIQQGVSPANLLAITFTNKAAGEMRERLQVLLGESVAGAITVRTFHAFGVLLLREFGAELGIPSDFVICSEADRLTILRRIHPDQSEKVYNQLLAQISTTKNQLVAADKTGLDRLFPNQPELVLIYRQYNQLLRANQMLDFDDLLFEPVRLLESHADLLRQVQERYRWISVDEYQDINLAQYRLLRLLTGAGANLCAIGDPDQAIYGFRGADRQYFLRFNEDYPDAQVLNLSQNYRSTQVILDASSQVIAKEASREMTEDQLTLRSDILDPTKLEIYAAPTDKAEAEYIVHQIEQMVGGTSLFSIDSQRATGHEAQVRSFGDFAVLYRLNGQSRLLTEAFERSGIPFQTVGQTPLTEYKEIREVVAALWSIYNPQSHWLLEQNANLIPLIGDLRPLRNAVPVAHLIESLQQRIGKHLSKPYEEKQRQRIQQLLRRSIPFGQDLAAFLEATTLQSEADYYDPRADRVTLMTLHAAKGLEFPVVFVIGCEERLLPLQFEDRSFDLEEERRLFYVGMTRAQRKLILTRANTRFLYGQRMKNEPSRFVNDIEETLKESKAAERRAQQTKPVVEQLLLF